MYYFSDKYTTDSVTLRSLLIWENQAERATPFYRKFNFNWKYYSNDLVKSLKFILENQAERTHMFRKYVISIGNTSPIIWWNDKVN